MSDVLELPFDQYQRYRLVADLLERVRGNGAPLSVLDVGGRTAVLREFLPSARITLVDMEASSEPRLVLGDGSRLPFADDAFDVVASFDTLEHVPPSRRDAFVAECARVAKRLAVICGPYDAPRVAEAERLLQRFLKDKLGVEHRYLDEHRHHGLPDRARVEQELRELGAQVTSIGHANLDRWLALQCVSMFMDYDPALRPLARAFQRWYNRSLYASDHADPVYRHAVIAAFDGTAIPSAAELLGPARAPQGTLAPFTELTAELVAFDREREAWRVEREALRTMADELREDLEGHHVALGESTKDRDAQRDVIATLQADLEGHHVALERARAELEDRHQQLMSLHVHVAGHEATVAELQSAYDAALEKQSALERDLAGHRTALAETQRVLEEERRGGESAREALTQDLAGHRRMLEELKQAFVTERKATTATRDALERDLDGHKKSLDAAKRELDAHQQSVAALTADLEGHKRALADRVERETALERELQAHKQTIAALEKDLSGHKAALAHARTDLDGHRKALAAANAHGIEIEHALAKCDEQLRSSLALAAGLEQSLAKREEVYDQLQRELRSRWRNLVRVFRLR